MHYYSIDIIITNINIIASVIKCLTWCQTVLPTAFKSHSTWNLEAAEYTYTYTRIRGSGCFLVMGGSL